MPGEFAALDAGVMSPSGVATTDDIAGTTTQAAQSMMGAWGTAIPGIVIAAPEFIIIQDGKAIGIISLPSPLDALTQITRDHNFVEMVQDPAMLIVEKGSGNIKGVLFGNDGSGFSLVNANSMSVDEDNGAIGVVPDSIGQQIVALNVGDVDRSPVQVQVVKQPRYAPVALCLASCGATVADYTALYNFFHNLPSYFLQEFIAGTRGLVSWRTGKYVTPANSGAGSSNWNGALVMQPSMPVIGVCASGYSLLYFAGDPNNVIDPSTGQIAQPVGWVQVRLYDGARQFSANTAWGYKGAQPTDTLAATTYQSPAYNPAGLTEGRQG